MTLNNLDIIILIFIGIGACVGLYNGFFKEIVGTIGLLLAAIAANYVSPYATPHLGDWVDNATLAAIIVWVVVFVLSMFVMKRIAYLLQRTMKAMELGWLNRLAGGGFGAIKYVLIAALAISVIEVACSYVDGLKVQTYLKGSTLVPVIHQIVDIVMPWASEHILKPALELLRN